MTTRNLLMGETVAPGISGFLPTDRDWNRRTLLTDLFQETDAILFANLLAADVPAAAVQGLVDEYSPFALHVITSGTVEARVELFERLVPFDAAMIGLPRSTQADCLQELGDYRCRSWLARPRVLEKMFCNSDDQRERLVGLLEQFTWVLIPDRETLPGWRLYSVFPVEASIADLQIPVSGSHSSVPLT
ncbi:MAG: hypothetical protein KDA85_20620 [Planctomycetaceae bacterium]|nr:hypothetical protein [Planctomycetaceae bacterium]